MLTTFDLFKVTVKTPRRAEILPIPSSTGTSRSHIKKKGNNEDTPVRIKVALGVCFALKSWKEYLLTCKIKSLLSLYKHYKIKTHASAGQNFTLQYFDGYLLLEYICPNNLSPPV